MPEDLMEVIRAVATFFAAATFGFLLMSAAGPAENDAPPESGDLIYVDRDHILGEDPDLGEVIREPHSVVVTRLVDKKRKGD